MEKKGLIIGAVVVVLVAAGAWLMLDGDNGDNGETGDNGDSVGTIDIAFLGETYSYDDASCDGSRAFPPENEQIRYYNGDENLEFWVERYDPEESDVVEVHMGFPEGGTGETIGEVEAYEAQTAMDEVSFELGSGTAGTVEMEPTNHMNDDVEYNPEPGELEWDISC